MKNIAIYRLERIKTAMERLGVAVTRLESAIQNNNEVDTLSSGRTDEGSESLATEIEILKQDYANLHSAAKKVSEKLDLTIDRLKTNASKKGQKG